MTKEKIFTNEILNDAELENINGGFLTAYFFLMTTMPDGQIVYVKDPLTLGLNDNPYSVLADNAQLFIDMLNHDAVAFAKPGENPFQKFANKNAWHWTDPLTYGNTVWALDMMTGKVTNYKA